MRKGKILVVASLLILIAAAPAHSSFYGTRTQYFTDSQLANMVGESNAGCDTSSWGTTADYKGEVVYNCNTGDVAGASCHHWTGSSWESAPCFYDGPTMMDGRLRIPVG